MVIYSFEETTENAIVLCLGGFDSIHKGHKLLIDYANEIKARYGASSAVFTYDDQFCKPNESVVFTYNERLLRLERAGVDEVCVASFTAEFANLSPEDFLLKLINKRKISAFVCGNDFRFGKKAQGNVDFLQEFCNKHGIPLFVRSFAVDETGEKISTSTIKNCLNIGLIEKVNLDLGDRYFIDGVVEEGRKMGRKLGFPTANISFEKNKLLPKAGVYATTVFINGKEYRAITNLGSAPTFNVEKYLLECHVDGYNGDLYSQRLTVYFDKYLRDIKKFENCELLIKQLNEDLKEIR